MAGTSGDTILITLTVPAWVGVAALLGARRPATNFSQPTSPWLVVAQATSLGAPLIGVLTRAVTPTASLMAALVSLLVRSALVWWWWGRWAGAEAGIRNSHPPSIYLPVLARRWQRAGTMAVATLAIAAVKFKAAFPPGWVEAKTCAAAARGGLTLMDAGMGVVIAGAGAAAAATWHTPPRLGSLAPLLLAGLACPLFTQVVGGYHSDDGGPHCNTFLILAAIRASGRWVVSVVPAALTGWVVPPEPPAAGALLKASLVSLGVHVVVLATDGTRAWEPPRDHRRTTGLAALVGANAEAALTAPGLWSLHAAAAALERWHAAVEERSVERAVAVRTAPRSLTATAFARAGRSAAVAASLGCVALAAARLAPPCRATANPPYLVCCLALHEAGSAASCAVIGLISAATGGVPAPVSPLIHHFPLLAGLGGPGALVALLTASTVASCVSWMASPHRAGPGKARVCLLAHFVVVVTSGLWAAAWRVKRRGVAAAEK